MPNKFATGPEKKVCNSDSRSGVKAYQRHFKLMYLIRGDSEFNFLLRCVGSL